MKEQRFLTTLTAVAACLAWSATAQAAAPLFYETFETYTITGGDDDPTNPGDGNANNWVQLAEIPDTAVQVVSGSTTNGLDANAQYLNIATTPDAGQSAFFGRSFTPVNGSGPTAPVLSFKVRPDVITEGDDSVNPSPGTRFIIYGQTATQSSVGSLTIVFNQVTEGNDAGLVLNHGFGPISPDGSVVTQVIPDLVAGHWYEVVLTFDFSTPVASFDITATDLDDPSTTVTMNDLYVRFDVLNLHTFRFTQSSGSSPAEFQAAALDDIVLTIPEPATLGMIVCAATASMLRRRRQRWGRS